MRRFAFIAILLAFTANSWAQDGSRFSTDGASVTWQHVYQTPLDSADVVDALLGSGRFDNIITTKDGFTCRIMPHEVNYRGAGMKRGLVSMYLLAGDMEGRAIVQIREGRYRVTVDGIVFTTKVSGGMFKEGERETLEIYALNSKGEFRSNFFGKGSSPVLDYDILTTFEIKDSEVDEDW